MPKAITFAQYGSADVLELTDIPLVEPAPGRVRVRVHASGVNPMDFKIRRGDLSGGKPLAAPRLTGLDLAGVVDALGEGVESLAVGDRVMGNTFLGTSAEYITAPVKDLALLPESVDFVTGAALGVAGKTAIRVLALAKAEPGQTILLHAATGGVGTFVTQLAVARGITVIGTASPRNLDYLSSLGAIAVEYGEGWEARVKAAAPAPIDAVIDASGAGVIEGSLNLVVPGGPIVTIADFGASGPGVIVTDGSEPGFENSLEQAVAAVADGTVTLPIEATFPLEQAADAQRLSETGHVRGKIVLTVS